MNLDIYVPSYKRKDAGLIKKLIEADLPFTIVLDHEQDMVDYAPLQSEKVKLMFVDKALGIGYVRQRIKDRYNGRPIIMLDDDTQLRLRRFDDPTRLPVCKDAETVRQWFETIDRFCAENDFDLGSAAESLAYTNTNRVLRSCNVCSVTIFNSDRCKEINYDPRLYKRMEDWDLILQAITRKFRFLVCNEVMRHCPMNKSAKDVGGCSEVYRDDKVMRDTTLYLRAKWGTDIVKLTAKKIGNIPDFKVDLKAFRKRYGYDY